MYDYVVYISRNMIEVLNLRTGEFAIGSADFTTQRLLIWNFSSAERLLIVVIGILLLGALLLYFVRRYPPAKPNDNYNIKVTKGGLVFFAIYISMVIIVLILLSSVPHPAIRRLLAHGNGVDLILWLLLVVMLPILIFMRKRGIKLFTDQEKKVEDKEHSDKARRGDPIKPQ